MSDSLTTLRPEMEFPTPDDAARMKRFSFRPMPEGGLERDDPLHTLHLAKESWEALEATNPAAFVGMTVFGSAVKGRMTLNSDIDLCVFVDTDFLPPIEDPVFSYQSVVRPGGEPDYDNDSRGKEMLESAHFLNLTRSGLRQRARELVGLEPSPVYIAMVDTTVSIFYLSIGSSEGKRKFDAYRNYFMTELESYGIDGEAAFGRVMARLKYAEEYRRGADIYLPSTIEEARRYWGLPRIDFEAKK